MVMYVERNGFECLPPRNLLCLLHICECPTQVGQCMKLSGDALQAGLVGRADHRGSCCREEKTNWGYLGKTLAAILMSSGAVSGLYMSDLPDIATPKTVPVFQAFVVWNMLRPLYVIASPLRTPSRFPYTVASNWKNVLLPTLNPLSLARTLQYILYKLACAPQANTY